MLHIFTAKPTKNCGGSSPLHPLFVCNGEIDCTNGIDEMNCTQGVNLCYYSVFPSRHLITDIAMCSLLLSETTCSAIRYQCSSGSCILKKNARCDGVHDCQDRSDEADCGEWSSSRIMQVEIR